jgi:hypothetical protein
MDHRWGTIKTYVGGFAGAFTFTTRLSVREHVAHSLVLVRLVRNLLATTTQLHCDVRFAHWLPCIWRGFWPRRSSNLNVEARQRNGCLRSGSLTGVSSLDSVRDVSLAARNWDSEHGGTIGTNVGTVGYLRRTRGPRSLNYRGDLYFTSKIDFYSLQASSGAIRFRRGRATSTKLFGAGNGNGATNRQNVWQFGEHAANNGRRLARRVIITAEEDATRLGPAPHTTVTLCSHQHALLRPVCGTDGEAIPHDNNKR